MDLPLEENRGRLSYWLFYAQRCVAYAYTSKGGSIMQGTALSLLPTWGNFYVIIGTAAASLTGLMFVVITLSAGVQNRKMSDGIGAFSTPTVFHFGAALLVAAILSAPWSMLWNIELLLALCGLGGVTYNMIVLRRVLRVLRQSNYNPVLEDWLWYIAFPLVSYIALIVAAMVLPANAALALFVIAAALLLVFIGIHNAWVVVTVGLPIKKDLTEISRLEIDLVEVRSL